MFYHDWFCHNIEHYAFITSVELSELSTCRQRIRPIVPNNIAPGHNGRLFLPRWAQGRGLETGGSVDDSSSQINISGRTMQAASCAYTRARVIYSLYGTTWIPGISGATTERTLSCYIQIICNIQISECWFEPQGRHTVGGYLYECYVDTNTNGNINIKCMIRQFCLWPRIRLTIFIDDNSLHTLRTLTSLFSTFCLQNNCGELYFIFAVYANCCTYIIGDRTPADPSWVWMTPPPPPSIIKRMQRSIALLK